ncbi:MAG: ArsR/SmtB family transcription factor [Mycoplasmatales bacterium]
MDIKVLKALADETRMEILESIIDDTCCLDKACACELIKKFNISQPTLSHHIKILDDADLINSIKNGKYTYFTINEERINEIILFLSRFSKWSNFLDFLMPKKLWIYFGQLQWQYYYLRCLVL